MQSQWQPIETAPRNGENILVFFNWEGNFTDVEAGMHVVYWEENKDYAGWTLCAAPFVRMGFDPSDDDSRKATHWMPLPEPPK